MEEKTQKILAFPLEKRRIRPISGNVRPHNQGVDRAGTMRKGRKTICALLCFAALAIPVAALAASSVKSTTYYNIYYDQWQGVADAMGTYLDAAFTTARDVLGYDNGSNGKIEIHFYSDPGSSTLGYTIPGSNSFYLNLTHGSSTSDSYLRDYGATAAHETSHVLFFHETRVNMSSGDAAAYTWLTEAISYYVGDVVYSYGDKLSKSALGSYLSSYSSNGSKKVSWWTSGDNYKNGSYSALDLVQLESIGLYLDSLKGWSGIQSVLTYLSQGNSVDSAFQKVYGKETGQKDTSTGSTVNTLYSGYIYYYLGHY